MYDLFNTPPGNLEKAQQQVSDSEIIRIKGLKYIPEFITSQEQNELINNISSNPWLTDIKRRVQHYGYKYDYKARGIDYSMFLGELPAWVNNLAKRLFNENYIEQQPDQVIVNEYQPGQGIANHIDCEPCFGETIISISLISSCIMDFIHSKTKEKVELLLEPGSLVVINNEARHIWTHGIQARKADIYNGRKIARNLRISLTFRKVIIKNENIVLCSF
jgi:alkylated DNA repair dioxygenase AlkB